MASSKASSCSSSSCAHNGEVLSVAGRVILITGASAGIGRHLSIHLAGMGATVVGCARRLTKLKQVAAEVKVAQRSSCSAAGRFVPIQCDLASEASIVDMFDKVKREVDSRGVQVLINNAGMGAQASTLGGSTADWRRMFEINVVALLTCTREAVVHMRGGKRAPAVSGSVLQDVGGGQAAAGPAGAGTGGDGGAGVGCHIINISSMSGHRVAGNLGVYAATKHAVRCLTEVTRRELRALNSPIRITQISPGLVRTEFAQALMQSREKADALYQAEPVLESVDVTQAVVYALTAPPRVEVHDVLMRPTGQKL